MMDSTTGSTFPHHDTSTMHTQSMMTSPNMPNQAELQSTTKHETNHSMASSSSPMTNDMPKESPSSGHSLSPMDPDNPMNWPLLRRVYVSSVAFAFAFVVAFGITSYTAGLSEVVIRFDVSLQSSIVGFSIIFFGIAFAPVYTPHATERLGRRTVYFISLPLFSLCVLGVGFANNFSTVLALRFLAGFFGGPCLVLIEGTFADCWSAVTTVSYYGVLTCASYMGVACGPLIGGFVFAAAGWQWMQWLTLILAVAAYLYGIGMPETYGREILRARARKAGKPIMLPAAQSGVSLAEMTKVTVITPLRMIVSEPLIIGLSLYVGLNFAVVFQFFITVPVVLQTVYGFSIQRVGLAFISAIGGVITAAITSALLDHLSLSRGSHSMKHGMPAIEKRLYPAMVGSLGIVASLFWIGWTASPKVSAVSPIFGTALYVWGNASVLISAISYLFDAYPPAGTLSGLTAAASFRLICAGIVPIFIVPMFMNLTGAWALSVFGFISAAMIPLPFLAYKFGPALRQKSRYSQGGMSFMEMEVMGRNAEPTTKENV